MKQPEVLPQIRCSLLSLYFEYKILPELFERCRADIEHNQQLFQSSKAGRLNKLLVRIFLPFSEYILFNLD